MSFPFLENKKLTILCIIILESQNNNLKFFNIIAFCFLSNLRYFCMYAYVQNDCSANLFGNTVRIYHGLFLAEKTGG